MDTVLDKLALDTDALNSLFTACSVGGYLGSDVAARLRQQYGLPDDLPLGEALADAGVLTDEEAHWLDDLD